MANSLSPDAVALGASGIDGAEPRLDDPPSPRVTREWMIDLLARTAEVSLQIRPVRLPNGKLGYARFNANAANKALALIAKLLGMDATRPSARPERGALADMGAAPTIAGIGGSSPWLVSPSPAMPATSVSAPLNRAQRRQAARSGLGAF
ncbi:MAG: hypothetical protein FJ318_06745 [SAR202 cluster bacterium]|nr:hypothetical protein [SAR202 cluster bacterium]